MDEDLQKNMSFAGYRSSLFDAKERLKVRIDTMLTFSINGGCFVATPELISFTRMVIDSGRTSVILVDVDGVPVEITDVPSFNEEMMDRYFKATNYYHHEYQKLRSSKTVGDIANAGI